MLRITQDTVDELVAVEDADELCRLLLGNPGGWGRSTRHAEAVELLTRLRGTGELPFSFAVVLVCTCRRWDRVTAKLIAAIQDSGLLHDAELDELADAFLAQDHVISYPLAWASPQWLEIDLHDGTGRTYTVTEDTPAQHRIRPEPPLRRWAARQAIHTRPERLAELLSTAERLEPRHRDAAINGLLDAAGVLDEPGRRTLIDRGLRGQRYAADPPTVDEIIAVMRHARHVRYANRLNGLFVVLWRAGLRINEALSLTETDLDERRGSLMVTHGKNDRRREVGMDAWGWTALQPWLSERATLPVGPLFCVIAGPTRGHAWSGGAARLQLHQIALEAGLRRRFAPHQLRHAHAVELLHEGVPLPLIQRQLGHSHLSTTGTYLQGISSEEIISTVHARHAPMMHASAGLDL